MILVSQSMRDQYYSTYLLATGHKPTPLPTNPDAARRAMSQHVATFVEHWVSLFTGTGEDERWKRAPYRDWMDTWADYRHWLESERLWQMMLEGLPDEPP